MSIYHVWCLISIYQQVYLQHTQKTPTKSLFTSWMPRDYTAHQMWNNWHLKRLAKQDCTKWVHLSLNLRPSIFKSLQPCGLMQRIYDSMIILMLFIRKARASATERNKIFRKFWMSSGFHTRCKMLTSSVMEDTNTKWCTKDPYKM